MSSLLNLSESRRSPITPPRRNPITLDGVQTPEFKKTKKPPIDIPSSPDKKEGIAKAEFSEKGRRSFSLAYEDPEPITKSKKIISPPAYQLVSGTVSRKKADCTPKPRNPIIQEEILYSPPKIRHKITESSVFKSETKQTISKIIGFKPTL
jgi:hypothetical protein